MDRSEASKITRIIEATWTQSGMPAPPWSLNDWRHEDLPVGSWSLASEGVLPYDWPWMCVDNIELTTRLRQKVGWWVELEAINGCILAMYDRRKDDDE